MAAKKMTREKPKLIAKEINLLPSSLRPKKYALKISKSLKRSLTIGYLFFVVATVVMAAAIFVLSTKLNGILTTQENLKNEIKAYQQTEQKVFLAKDRLEKIGNIYESDYGRGEVEIFADTVEKFTEGVDFFDASIGEDQVDVTVITQNSHDLGKFISVLVGSSSYKGIELTNFHFEPETGYTTTFLLSK